MKSLRGVKPHSKQSKVVPYHTLLTRANTFPRMAQVMTVGNELYVIARHVGVITAV